MRVLILNTDYGAFLAELYARNPGLESKPYAEQMQTRFDTFFGVADFYSRNLMAAGHDAETLIVNNHAAQQAWAREAGMPVDAAPASSGGTAMRVARSLWTRAPRTVTRLASRMLPPRLAFDPAILEAQIRRFRPDVVINQAIETIPSSFIREMRPHVRLMVAQHAAPMPRDQRFDAYDLMISSLPNYVARFRALGLRSELQRFAFERRVLEHLPATESTIPLSFVGTLSRDHRTRMPLFDYLASTTELQVWGRAVEPISRRSPLYERYRGPAFGLDMYRLLHASKATLNFHLVDAGAYANNMRLFEATGTGTLLVTDAKENLHEMFEPEREVVTFRTKEECREKIEFYLAHEAERRAVAEAGQRRTLRDHTYDVRMPQLVETLRKYL